MGFGERVANFLNFWLITINFLFLESKYCAKRGASLSDEQREEMTNREGVAACGATKIKFVSTNAILKNMVDKMEVFEKN